MFTLPIRQVRAQEHGGITIMVALMLLVLLTVTAMSMSKNSLREIMVTGTMRQAVEVKSQADTGLDWSLYWIASGTGVPAPTTGQPGATRFVLLRDKLQEFKDKDYQKGRWYFVDTTAQKYQDLYNSYISIERWNDLDVMYMGKIDMDPTAQNQEARIVTQIQPDIFCVRARATAKFPNGLTFKHTREVWTTIPIKN